MIAPGLEEIEASMVVEDLGRLRGVGAVHALVKDDDLGVLLLEVDERVEIEHGGRLLAAIAPRCRLLDREAPAEVEHDGTSLGRARREEVIEAQLLEVLLRDALLARLALREAVWMLLIT